MASSPKSDAADTANILRRRDEVFETLSRRFRVPLLRFFERRIGRQAENEDLVPKVFVRLANEGRLASIEHMESYLFTTAANLLRDRQRRRAARASEAHDTYEDDLHGSARETHTPERAVSASQALEQLVEALHELPERTRNVWLLYHVEDLPHAAIASRLDIAVSTIEKHLGRANVFLLQRIDRPGE